MGKLDAFIDEAFGDEDEVAFEEFWDRHLERESELPGDFLLMSRDVQETWFAFDHRLDDGTRIIDRFLAVAALNPRERAFLEAMRRSTMRLYEVTETVPGSSMTLRDVVEGSVVTVHERTASRTMSRREWLAARVIPRGCSGLPEMERGVLQVPALTRDHFEAAVRKQRNDFVTECSGEPIDAFYETMPPFFHDAWIMSIFEPPMPRLANTDGEEMIITSTSFHVDDHDALARALDGSGREGISRTADGTWCWDASGSAQDGVILASLALRDGILTVETNSVERGVRARGLVERLAGAAIRHRGTTHEDIRRTVAESLTARVLGRVVEPAEPEPAVVDPDTAEALLTEHYAQHYRAWVDEPVPAIDGLTPREAARRADMRARVEDLIRGIEGMYERALKEGQPAHDPSWMWSELGLRPEANPPRPPALAHERVAQRVPGSAEASRAAAERARKMPSFSDATTILEDDALALDLGLQRFLRDGRWAEDRGGGEATVAAPYIPLMVNLDLHRRKIFWVDAALSYMLECTDVDLAGRELRTPFPSFALVFTDRHALSLGERLLSRSSDDPLRGQILRVATAYVTERHRAAGRALDIVFAFDALGADLPSLVRYEVPADGDASVRAFLESVAPGVVVDGVERVTSPARRLLRLALNAILYATSAGVNAEILPAAPRELSKRAPMTVPTSDSVFFLPGKIDIRRVKQLQELERSPNGLGLLSRFMVRGHWRRPGKNWDDQRLRWIEPYWKGPDLAAVIEKTYRLKP